MRLLILFFLCCFTTLYAQPVAQIFTKNTNTKIDNKFEKAYGFFLRRYAKTYKPKHEYFATTQVIVAYFNKIIGTNEFNKINFVKYIGIQKPDYMDLYEFNFTTIAAAQRVELCLQRLNGDCSKDVAPHFFIFTRVGTSIFFADSGAEKNDKLVKSLAHCLKTFKINSK